MLAGLGTGLVGCGGDGGDDELVVSAAASLSEALPAYAESGGYEGARFSFAGSDELAAQIRQGAAPDVYAAANTSLPEELHAEGRLERPVAFATNRLVLAVPAGSDSVRSLTDLSEPDVRIAIGDENVPVGIYTREVLGRLGAAESEAILANTRSNEPDVLGIVAKLTQGAVDAGFVYRSDVSATEDRLEAIALPARLRPEVAYGAGVVTDAEHPAEAAEFVDGLLSADGQRALREAGFLPPP
ncbi:MAG: molybdate ABC transporter substrate-binding protein [Solirubrobacterales bacterium]